MEYLRKKCDSLLLLQISALSGDALNWRSEPTVATTTASSNHSNDQTTNIPTATEMDPSLYDGIKLGKATFTNSGCVQ